MSSAGFYDICFHATIKCFFRNPAKTLFELRSKPLDALLRETHFVSKWFGICQTIPSYDVPIDSYCVLLQVILAVESMGDCPSIKLPRATR